MISIPRNDCLKHDLHIHSVQSACGIHSVMEILEIAHKKGLKTINICDHGSAAGRKMNFGVIADRRRTPKIVQFDDKSCVNLLVGIEANILDDGESDIPSGWKEKPNLKFDLISAGFHSCAKNLKEMKDPEKNFQALKKYLDKYPLDILTHPCIKNFPLPVEKLVALSADKGFALEVNNTNLIVDKTDVEKLKKMILLATESHCRLVCNSDGHTFFEIGECGMVRNLLEKQLNLKMETTFPLNFNDDALNLFIEERVRIRET